MFSWIFAYPDWAMLLLFGLGAMALSLIGMMLIRPLFHRWIHGQDRTNEMVSLNIASFSLFYGIMLGLVAVGVYANYAATSDIVEKEASTLAALYSDTGALPEPHRTQLLADLRAYANATIERDWPDQVRGAVPKAGTASIARYQRDLADVRPAGRSDEVAYAQAFGQLEKLIELRANRLERVSEGLPDLLWWVIEIGAVLTIVVVWMLDMQAHVHGILTAVLSLFLGIVMFLIADMDKPFRAAAFVGPDAYTLVYNQLMNAR